MPAYEMPYFTTMRVTCETTCETYRLLHRECLCRCPRSEIVVRDNDTEITKEFQETLKSCGVRTQPIKVDNTRLNLIEWTRSTLGDIICAGDFGFVENTMREVDILFPSCTQVLRSTASAATEKKSRAISL